LVKNATSLVKFERTIRLASRHTQADGISMGETEVTLLGYVFRRANGSYRYKRNVHKRLHKYIRKATLYRQLGTTYKEAMDREICAEVGDA
jgi:hypothetical protein